MLPRLSPRGPRAWQEVSRDATAGCLLLLPFPSGTGNCPHCPGPGPPGHPWLGPRFHATSAQPPLSVTALHAPVASPPGPDHGTARAQPRQPPRGLPGTVSNTCTSLGTCTLDTSWSFCRQLSQAPQSSAPFPPMSESCTIWLTPGAWTSEVGYRASPPLPQPLQLPRMSAESPC